MNREQTRDELKTIILAHLQKKNIDPNNRLAVMTEAPWLWDALVKSGRLPRQLTYDMFMGAILKHLV